ncbi:MAG: transglycosylase SLT domain-containing protein [Burkholderiales bacterium]|nr:transglycosylase SLT domain-containing protein [Burkholderiales bacterium]
MMSLGIIAIFLLALMFIKPDLTEKFKSLSPYSLTPSNLEQEIDETVAPKLSLLMATPQQLAQAQASDASATADQYLDDRSMLGNQKQQLWVTNWLAKRYRVANDASNMLVSAAYLTAKEIKLDPLLILSVMAIESGLNPFAESPVGAQGLMQVMSKIHHEKFEDMGGVKAALNPVANIRVGALILKDYVTRGGSVEAGLKMYVGAAAFDNDAGYGSRVLAEYRRLKDVATGKNVPTFVTTPVAQPQIRAIETETNVKPNSADNKKIIQEQRMQEQVARL